MTLSPISFDTLTSISLMTESLDLHKLIENCDATESFVQLSDHRLKKLSMKLNVFFLFFIFCPSMMENYLQCCRETFTILSRLNFFEILIPSFEA